ncbi:PREDICTED: uncharacterized protein LOC106323691 [Brassica oleracea var. oleracea]|uniref:uncharacterized protein LOC106323691 n=1 Tax=Brassica oleracea var. oleracea TaxID=109376 RepID=UPI0006A73AB6|nr:PREDICTED: uncharacterized protein LOC106323691 [Brassica oleracea var. oleracea]
MLKVDIRKAFDTVCWDFVVKLLEAQSFPLLFITWIKECITSPRFSIAINGELAGFFPGQKGLRQGDSISPYLFIMIMEVLSKLLGKAADEEGMNLHPLCQTPRWTGMELNPAKTEIFFGGFSQIEAAVISDLAGFRRGSFPTRYLGLPLDPNRISFATLQPFLERITSKLNSWTVNSLSFAGKVRMVISVIYGSSLWVEWLKENVFKRKCYWEIQTSQRLSPTVRGMIGIRDTVREFLRWSVGHGRAATFWFDWWSDLGPLITALGEAGPHDLRIPISAFVSDDVVNGDWSLPAARSEEAVTLQIVLSMMAPPTSERGADKFLWRNATDHFLPRFSSRDTWNRIRVGATTVSWHKLVWFKEEIPRCSFITWLAILGRLPTRDMLSSWGLSIPFNCVLCSSGIENHDHLFFRCPYAIPLNLFFR